jgi:hypothetical protein
MGEALQAAAASLPIWRDTVVAGLAAIVIGALWLYATLIGVE